MEWQKTIPQVIREAAVKWPDHEAIVTNRQRISYREVFANACRLAKGLQLLGIKQGDHVATIMGGYPEWVYSMYGIAMLGAVVVPINQTFRERELEFVLRHSDVKALITMDQFRGTDYMQLLRNLIPELDHCAAGFTGSARFPMLRTVISFSPEGRDHAGCFDFGEVLNSGNSYTEGEVQAWMDAVGPEDISSMLFTSGSTAFPKPTLRAHGSNVGVAQYLFSQGVTIGPEDRFLGYFPFYHIAGAVYVILGCTVAGATVVLMEFYEPGEALRLIQEEKVTFIGGFDTHFITLSGHPRFRETDVTSVSKVLLACGPEWYDKIKALGLGPRIIAHHYGFTEGTGVVMPASEPSEVLRKNTNGKPFPGVQVKIVNPETGQQVLPGTPGEICLKGWTLFKGYYKMPQETSRAVDEDGFFHTGDYGWLDDQGYLYYRGRYKQMVKTGGENVSEREVEMVIEGHPDVKVVQVVGVPDPMWGEVVVALIETRSGNVISHDEVVAFCKDKLAGFKIPKHVVQVDGKAWPITPTGKYDKFRLRRMAMEQLGIDAQ